MIPVTDEWYVISNNDVGMIVRSAMRRSLSFVLSLVVVLWANAGLAMLPASGHGSKCHARMVHMHQHATHSATLAAALGCCHQRSQSMPCCPSHPAPAPTHCADRPGCCDISSQPARPLAFLAASGNFLSAQLSANGPAGLMMSASPRYNFLPINLSPQFVRPVFELKRVLRI